MSHLGSFTFLAFFSMSHNHLTRPTPQRKPFDTFPNCSFDGNPRLCGNPLPRVCESSKGWLVTPPPLTFGNASPSDFDWKILLRGYGSRLVIGVSTRYCLTMRKHKWLVETFER